MFFGEVQQISPSKISFTGGGTETWVSDGLRAGLEAAIWSLYPAYLI